MVLLQVDDDKLTYLLIGLSFLDYLGVSMIVPQLSLKFRSIGASQLFVGLISSVYGALQLISAPLVGRAQDRYGRRITLVTCCVILTISYILLGINTSVIGMLVLRSVLGLSKHTQSSYKVIGGDINTGIRRSYFISRINSIGSGAFMLGPLLIASIESDRFSMGCFICSGCFVVVTILSFLSVHETLNLDTAQQTNSSKEKPSITQSFRRFKKLHYILLYRFCAATSVIVLRYFTPLYTQHYFGFTAKDASYMASFTGLSGIICSYSGTFVSKIIPDKHQLLKYLSIALVLSVLSSILSPNMPCLLLTQFFLSFATQNLRIVVDSIILDMATESDRGEVFGLGTTVVGLGRVGAPLIAGALAEAHMMLPLLCCTGLALIGSIILYSHKDVKVE